MSNSRRFRQKRKKSTPIISNLIDSWKVRPIHGFEKHLFVNMQASFNNTIGSTKSTQRSKKNSNIDPARFIYPRDAMGNMLIPLINKSIPIVTPFYLPKYDITKPRSPVWSIKNVYHSKEIIHYVGPMTYDSVNDRSQLPCKSGWTQIGRQSFNIKSGLIVPFYDTRKYKQVGDPCSKHAVIIGRRTSRKEIKFTKHSNIAITKRNRSIDKNWSSTKHFHQQSNNLTAFDDNVSKVEITNLPSLKSLTKTEPKIIVTEQETNVLQDEKDSAVQLKILPSEEFETLPN